MNMPSEIETSKSKENIRYFELSFIGKFSKFNENELKKLTKLFRILINFTIVFNIFKLSSFFQLIIKFHMVLSPM